MFWTRRKCRSRAVSGSKVAVRDGRPTRFPQAMAAPVISISCPARTRPGHFPERTAPVNRPPTTPEEFSRDFACLLEAHDRSLRTLSAKAGVGVETIRGWKTGSNLPHEVGPFLRVIDACLGGRRRAGAVLPAWLANKQTWEARLKEAKDAMRLDRVGDHHSSKPIPVVLPSQQPPPPVQVFGGDYVANSKSSVHIGDVNHYGFRAQ